MSKKRRVFGVGRQSRSFPDPVEALLAKEAREMREKRRRVPLVDMAKVRTRQGWKNA